jgi:hypothetical protein
VWLEVNTTYSEPPLCTFKTVGDELTITRPGVEPYTAKFDGNEYPVKGSDEFDTASLKRLGERSFEETNKLKGKVVESSTLTVSNDGKTLTIVAVEKPSDRKRTWVLTKAPEQLAKK